MLCSNLGDENSDTVYIKWSCGPRAPHPCFNQIAFVAARIAQ